MSPQLIPGFVGKNGLRCQKKRCGSGTGSFVVSSHALLELALRFAMEGLLPSFRQGDAAFFSDQCLTIALERVTLLRSLETEHAGIRSEIGGYIVGKEVGGNDAVVLAAIGAALFDRGRQRDGRALSGCVVCRVGALGPAVAG